MHPQVAIPSNLEISQQLSALQVDLIAAKVIASPSVEEWHSRYVNERVLMKDLTRLVPGSICDKMLEDWLEESNEDDRKILPN